jgi:hypothetical protein
MMNPHKEVEKRSTTLVQLSAVMCNNHVRLIHGLPTLSSCKTTALALCDRISNVILRLVALHPTCQNREAAELGLLFGTSHIGFFTRQIRRYFAPSMTTMPIRGKTNYTSGIASTDNKQMLYSRAQHFLSLLTELIRHTIELLGGETYQSELSSTLKICFPDVSDGVESNKQFFIMNLIDMMAGQGLIEVNKRKNRKMIRVASMKPFTHIPAGESNKYKFASYGEARVWAMLEDIAQDKRVDEIKSQHYEPLCRDRKPLPFDFGVRIGGRWKLIEVDGEQHRQFTPHFHATAADFARQQQHDKIKTDFCAVHDIPLLRIEYTAANLDIDSARLKKFILGAEKIK